MKRNVISFLLQFAAMFCFGQTYHLGDLYTAGDGSQGIVFFVAADGGGWAVALHDAPGSYVWSLSGGDIPALPNYDAPPQMALADTSGYANTLAMRNYIGAEFNNAAAAVDFEHGWYMPAAAQLSLIYAQLPFIQAALTAAGGTPMQTEHSSTVYSWQDIYWTSTESSSNEAWLLPFTEDAGAFATWSYYTGTPMQVNKSMSARVRAVCSFPPPENENIYDTTLTYSWNTGSTEPHFSDVPLQTTNYTVTVSNAYGCTNSASVAVTVISNEPQTYYDTICQGATYNSYGFVLTAEETAGILDTILTQTISAAGCESEITVYLTLLPPDVVEIEEHAGQSFVWNGVTYTEEGTYTQYFNNRFGCDSTVILTLTLDGIDPDTATVEETDPNVLYLPNAFTPNDDGKNTIFLPVFSNPDEIEEYRMEIYNRWGGLVFRTEELTFGWDGANAMEGVYVVLVGYKSCGMKPKTVKGSVTLIR